MGELRLRAACEEDVPALVALINEAYRVEEFFVSGPRTNAADVEQLRRSGVFLLSEAEGHPSGCVYVAHRGGRGYFGLLAVAPRFQGRGLGRRLVTAAEDHLRAEGHQEVEILVVDRREELFPFYAQLGYRVAGEEPFPEGYDLRLPCRFVVLRKPLG